MTNEERHAWLMSRKATIGASDVGGLLGLADPRWSTPISVWESKISDDVDATVSGPAAMGTDLEPWILQELGRRLEADVHALNSEPVRHATVPLAVNPDGMVYDAEVEQWIPIEVKFATGDELSSWGNDPALGWNMLGTYLNGDGPFPAQTVIGGYYCQIQAQMLCTGAPYGWLVGVIGARAGYLLRIGQAVPSNAWRQLRVPADRDMHRAIEKACANFWSDYVETKQPPPCIGQADLAALKAAYKLHVQGACIDAPASEEHARAVVEAKAIIKAQTAIKDAAEAELRRMLGDNERATCGGYEVSAKTTARGNRPMRVKQVKA